MKLQFNMYEYIFGFQDSDRGYKYGLHNAAGRKRC